jgi:twitching motility protein PilT
MARLDSFLDSLKPGEELLLETNRDPSVRSAAGLKAIVSQPLGTAQIKKLMAEIAPLDRREAIEGGKRTVFSYERPDASFNVTLMFSGEAARAVIERAAVASTGGESPAIEKSEPLKADEAVPAADDSGIIKREEFEATIDEAAMVIEAPSAEAAAVEKPSAPTPEQSPKSPAPSVVEISSRRKGSPGKEPEIHALLRLMIEKGASDLHLSSLARPMLRLSGDLTELADRPAITPDGMRELLAEIIPEANAKEFSERRDSDFPYEIEGLARFRANVFMDRRGMGAVFRQIPYRIITAEQLGLSREILDLCYLNKGLVVVTGPTGSGKSTTLCAMIDYINRNRNLHIITIEDPIEFVHENKKCLVNQREVRVHTESFSRALRAALREDPDIILVGEMRDLETIAIAIETAETGHLVFGTLHTTTAASTVDRIIDQFPTERQSQVRAMLSSSLKGVIAQTLLKKSAGGRVAALEVLITNAAISNLIREGKVFQIPSVMQTGKAQGMEILNDALMRLVMDKTVAPDEAYFKSVDKAGFLSLLKARGIDIKVKGPQ